MNEDANLSSSPLPDREAEFFRLFAGSQARVFAYILTLLPHWADAEEVFQETCVALWKDFAKFEPGSDFVRWAFKIAFHRVLSFRKRQRRESPQMSEEFIASVAAEVEQRNEALDDRLQALSQCVERLVPRDRELLRERYHSGETAKGVAERLGRPADTVYKALARIRRALLECVNRTLSAQEQG